MQEEYTRHEATTTDEISPSTKIVTPTKRALDSKIITEENRVNASAHNNQSKHQFQKLNLEIPLSSKDIANYHVINKC